MRWSGVAGEVDLLMVAKRRVIREQNDELAFFEAAAEAPLEEFSLGGGEPQEFVATISSPLPAVGFQWPRQVAIESCLGFGVERGALEDALFFLLKRLHGFASVGAGTCPILACQAVKFKPTRSEQRSCRGALLEEAP